MQNSRTKWQKIILQLLILATCKFVNAGNLEFATMQYDNGNGAKLTVISGFESAQCNKIIQNFDSGMKVDCPSCKLESSGCSNEILSYNEVWNKKKFIVPYVVFGNQRYIMAGTSRVELEQWCTNTALRFKSFGKDAQCLK